MLLTYLVQFFISFGAVFLKGFQQQNVIAGYIKSAGLLSFVMACFDVAVIALVVKSGWISVIPIGLGASLGIMAAMILFKKVKEKKDKTVS